MVPRADNRDALRLLWQKGQQAWPDLRLDAETFIEHRLRLPLDCDVERLHAEDLFLACACATRIEGAAEALKTRHQATLERQLRGLEPRREAAEELVHDLFVRILVGTEDQVPRIAEYSGRGPLSAWLRMAATRSALNARRDEARRAELRAEHAPPDPVTDVDPELAFVKARYPDLFADVMKQALAALPREERSLLRLHYVEGLTMEAIAEANQWSRAGAHRRVAAARTAALAAVRAHLVDHLGIAPQELESLMRVLASRIHVSLAGVLGD